MLRLVKVLIKLKFVHNILNQVFFFFVTKIILAIINYTTLIKFFTHILHLVSITNEW